MFPCGDRDAAGARWASPRGAGPIGHEVAVGIQMHVATERKAHVASAALASIVPCKWNARKSGITVIATNYDGITS